MRLSRALVDWMLPSIALEPKAHPGPVTEQTTETYAATFDTNVLGTLLSMKHELRVMLAQGRGSIVNVSSTYGHTGAAGASVYSASKRERAILRSSGQTHKRRCPARLSPFRKCSRKESRPESLQSFDCLQNLTSSPEATCPCKKFKR